MYLKGSLCTQNKKSLCIIQILSIYVFGFMMYTCDNEKVDPMALKQETYDKQRIK